MLFTEISPPFKIFTSLSGTPLENGSIYIGVANQNPEVNPVQVFWDSALTIPAAQPIRTLGGYPARNGSPARLYCSGNYSITVKNKKGALVYSASSTVDQVSSANVEFEPSGTGAVPSSAQKKLRERVTPQDFGAVGNGVVDDTESLRLFFNYLNTNLGGATAGYTGTASTRTGWVPAANYLMSGAVSLGAYLDVQCDKRAMFTSAPGYTGVLFYSLVPYQIRWSGGIFQASANGVGGIWWMGNANYPTSPINLDQGYCCFENFEAKGFQDVFPVLVNRSAQFVIQNFKCDRNIHLIGRGTNLDVLTGLYSQTAPRLGYGGYADRIDIGPGWITSSDIMSTDHDGVICADTVHTKDLLLVPIPHSGVECAWVNCWSSHSALNIRYGGEPGSFAPCNYMGTFQNTYPIAQTYVTIEGSDIYCVESQSTTLSAGIDASTTTIPLTDGSKFPTYGSMVVGTERVTWFNRAGNTITSEQRSSLAVSHLAGESVTLFSSTVVRLFSGAPNLIKITGNRGGQDMANFISYWYGESSGTWQTNANSPLFKCVIKDNAMQAMIGDFWPAFYANTTIDRDRTGQFLGTVTTTGSPGLIRTPISTINCRRPGTYRMRVRINSGTYWQTFEGVLNIERYYDGATVSVMGSFVKVGNYSPPIGGAPSNLDTVAVKFIYTNGGLSASNAAPQWDSNIVQPVLELSASVGSVSGTEIVYWEVCAN